MLRGRASDAHGGDERRTQQMSSEPADQDRSTGGRRRRLGWLGVAAAAVAGIVTFTTALTALVFQLLPGLKPSEPPVRISGAIRWIRLEPDVTLGGFLHRVGANTRHVSPKILSIEGVVAYVGYRLDGARTEKGTIDAIWYSASGQARLAPQYQAGYSGQDTPDRSSVNLSAEQTGGVAIQWMPVPVRLGGTHTYRIDEELRYKSELVDIAQSRVIRCDASARLPCARR